MSLWLALAAGTGCGLVGPAPDVPALTLSDPQGVVHSLGAASDVTAVLFVAHGVGCPIVRKSTTTVNGLRDAFGDAVAVMLVNANPHDSPAAVAAEVADFGLEVPVLLDPQQQLASALGFMRTAEAAVVDTDTWRIQYHGALDDRLEFGMEKPAATHHYAHDALSAVLAGTPVAVPRTRAKGCAIPLL